MNQDSYTKDREDLARIIDIGQDGEGIGKALQEDGTTDGFTLFIKDALVGDEVRAKIMKAKKGYAFARLMEVVKPGPGRIQPPCPIARACGGCQIQALSYDRQLAFKQAKVRNDLVRIGGFEADEIDRLMRPIVGMEEPYRFRNKAQVPFSEKNGKVVYGYYAGRTHSVIPMEDCLIGYEGCGRILDTVRSWMETYHVPAYREEDGTGLVRHVLIRNGVRSKEVMVCLVTNGRDLPHREVLVKALTQLPGVVSVVQSINRDRTNVILGREIRTLAGKDSIRDTLRILDVVHTEDGTEFVPRVKEDGGEAAVSFDISPLSFYQVNPKQTEKLYSLALEAADLTGTETVWDVYCGVGTISLFLAGSAGSVFGVEIVERAVEDARRNAEANGIQNVRFVAGKAEEVLPAFVRKQEDSHVDVVVVDPPRKGLDAACIGAILGAAPERIVYVSCDPATLARDLRSFADGGYILKSVQPVDQFGHSIHVETVVLISRA